MGHFFTDMIAFLKSLSVVDFILYFAVLILVILIVSLIYIMKTSDFNEDKDILEEKKTDDVPISLEEIVNTIDENPTPAIDMTAYEAEQEEKAIISYDELVRTAKMKPVSYETQEMIDDSVQVKKVHLDSLAESVTVEEPKVEVKLFSYEKEEAFLKALKQLNELLS